MRSMLAAFALFLSGCGYGFHGGGSILPSDIRSIYVPLVENESTEQGLSALVTEAIRDQFERYGVVTVVDEPATADAVLKVRILRVNNNTQSVSSRTDTALQYAVSLALAGELRRSNGGLLWRNINMQVSSTYGATGDTVVASSSDFAGSKFDVGALSALDSREISRGQQQEAFNTLSEQVAQKIYDEAVAPDF